MYIPYSPFAGMNRVSSFVKQLFCLRCEAAFHRRVFRAWLLPDCRCCPRRQIDNRLLCITNVPSARVLFAVRHQVPRSLVRQSEFGTLFALKTICHRTCRTLVPNGLLYAAQIVRLNRPSHSSPSTLVRTRPFSGMSSQIGRAWGRPVSASTP